MKRVWFPFEAKPSYDNLMLWEASTTAFFGFCHSGEITTPSENSYDPNVHLSYRDITTDNPKINVHLCCLSGKEGHEDVHRQDRRWHVSCCYYNNYMNLGLYSNPMCRTLRRYIYNSFNDQNSLSTFELLLMALTISGFCNWKKGTGKNGVLSCHANSVSHKQAEIAWQWQWHVAPCSLL